MTSRIIARIAGLPWLIQAEALETIIQIAGRDLPDESTLEAWKLGHQREALATRLGDPLGNAPTARVRDGVAIVPIAGPIFRYANLFTAFSGATALADVSANLAAAASDNRIRAVLLEIDTPGGEVTGLAQAAQQIAALARVKPVVAFVEGSAMSAGYWLASAAGQIVMDSTAAVGSLGAVLALQDRTEAEARTGTRRYRFVSTQTPNKLLDPTTDAGVAKIQAYADRLAAEFLGAAAANRGMSVDGLLAATDGGGLLIGADAVSAGLADQVAGFEETLARLAAGNAPLRAASPIARASAAEPPIPTEPGPAPRAISQEPSMKTMPDAPAPAPETTAQQPQAPAPVAAPAPAAEVPQPQAAQDPVIAERARCAAIQAAAKPGQQALASLAVEEGWSVETFTKAQAATHSAVESARAEGAGGAFRDSLPKPVAGDPGADPAPAEGEEKWKSDFASDAKLRAEFGQESTYLAFKAAEAAGKVRSIKRA